MQELKHYIQNYKQLNIAAMWLLFATSVILLLPHNVLSLSIVNNKSHKSTLQIPI